MNTLKHIAAVLVVALLGGNIAAADTSQPPCVIRLRVDLAPDLPNPRDLGFLSSLLGNHPGYQVTLLRESSDTVIVLDLTGPGPDERCQDVIETMRKDGRILTVHEL